jgi:hypothetical protein
MIEWIAPIFFFFLEPPAALLHAQGVVAGIEFSM